MRVVLLISLGFFPALIHTSDWANIGWRVSGLLEGIFNSIKDDTDIETGPTNLPLLFRKAGGIAKFLGVVGPVFGLLTVILPGDHEFEKIMAQFEIVNQELGKLGRAMENLEEQLKYEHAKTQIHGDFSTMETAVDLYAIYSNISNSDIARNTSRDSLMLMETDLLLAITSVLKGQNGENEFASTNLFESIYGTSNGDLMYLAMVCDTVHGTVVNSILAYHTVIFIKYTEEGEDEETSNLRAQEACQIFDQDMEKMQILMAEFLELCETEGSSNVIKEINYLVDTYGQDKSQELAKKIKSQLELKYYWLDFVVIVYPGRNPRDYVHTGHKYYRHYKNNEIVVMFKEVSVPSKFVETQWLYDHIMGSFGCWKWEKYYYINHHYLYHCGYNGRDSASEIHRLLRKSLQNAGIEDFGISVVQLVYRKGTIGPVFWEHSNIGSSVYALQSKEGWFHVTVALQNAHIGSSFCPSSHPHLYNYGQDCCKEASESGSENSRPPCDNGDISYTSRCCENSLKCTGWGGCRNACQTKEDIGWECQTSYFPWCDRIPFYLKKSKPCQFPFTYKGKEFTGCSTLDNFEVPWCATKTKNGKFVEGEWGNCSESCMLFSGKSLDKIGKVDPKRLDGDDITKAECLELGKQCVE